jgi:salicylate hydroxylase
MPSQAERRIVIIGGGLGGTAVALALAQRGFEVAVYEQAPVFREVGAGLTLLPSAMRALHSLGVWEAVRQASSGSSAVALLHYETGEMIAGIYNPDWQAHPADPHSGGHSYRPDVHRILVDALRTRAPQALHPGHRLVAINQDSAGVTARFANGEEVRGDLLLGSDGIRSTVRALRFQADAPVFAGQVCYRFMIPAGGVERYLSAGRAAGYMGPGRSFLRYGVREGHLLNCVALVQTDSWQREGWTTPASREEVLQHFGSWHPDVIGLIKGAPDDAFMKWGAFERPVLPTWHSGRIALLGDAAHAMLPFLGLGAATAIEDAIVLARALEAFDDHATAFQRYEAVRIERTARIAAQSRRQGQVIQAEDPRRYLAANPPTRDRTLTDYDPMAVAL